MQKDAIGTNSIRPTLLANSNEVPGSSGNLFCSVSIEGSVFILIFSKPARMKYGVGFDTRVRMIQKRHCKIKVSDRNLKSSTCECYAGNYYAVLFEGLIDGTIMHA